MRRNPPPNLRLARIFLIALVAYVALMWSCYGLTPTERAQISQKVQLSLDAVNEGLRQNEDLRAEAEQAHIETKNANDVAMMAASSAMTTGLKAKNALEEAERCKKENEAMRPIVAAVSGPWWFPGLNALLYGIKKCSISLLVIIAGIVVILVIIKLTTGLSFGALFNPIINFFSKIPGWISQGISKLKPKPKP